MATKMSRRHAAGALAILTLPMMMLEPARAAAQSSGNLDLRLEERIDATVSPRNASIRTCEVGTLADITETPFSNRMRSKLPTTRAESRYRVGKMGGNCFYGAHEPPLDDEDPFPQRIEISFTLESHEDGFRTDDVTFAATKQEPCSPGGSCLYDMDPQAATVSIEYNDTRYGCQGTASGPPFARVIGRVGFDIQGDDGSYPFSFSTEFDYSTGYRHCDDGTSGPLGGYTAGSSDQDAPWEPGQEESLAVPVSNISSGGRGYANISYYYYSI
ncbi:hypothetical protein [Actinoplanes xinjiangensis]|uniref:hypothetical protein n=1 Tax=Actinoplanes xinjiangensis TaxID=512350 RepID=UPI0034209DB4